MNKQEIMKRYSKEEDRLLAARLLDKIQFTNAKHQIQITDFLDGYEQKIAHKILEQINDLAAIFYGGYEEAERKMIFFFPDKLQNLLTDEIKENKIIQDLIRVISITLPNELKGKYHHRDYLSGLMKLGIKREKIGDILVREDGADILVQKDMISYLLTNLSELTRFQKADIIQKSITELKIISIQKEKTTILVPQMRLDIIVSELLHTSREKSNEVIAKERVFINYEVKKKKAMILQQGDLLTIRGKGKFQIGEIIGQTAKGKFKVVVEKYVS